MAKRPGILLPWPTLVMSALILAMIFLSSTSMAYNFNTEEKTLTPAGGRMQNSLYGYHRFHPTINDKVNFLEVCLHCFWYIFSKKECGRAVWCDRMFQLFVRIVDLLLASRNILYRPIVINIVDENPGGPSIHPSIVLDSNLVQWKLRWSLQHFDDKLYVGAPKTNNPTSNAVSECVLTQGAYLYFVWKQTTLCQKSLWHQVFIFVIAFALKKKKSRNKFPLTTRRKLQERSHGWWWIWPRTRRVDGWVSAINYADININTKIQMRLST